MSNKTKNIVVISLLLLAFVSPLFGFLGVALMWFWTKWKTWIKILITLPFVLILIGLLLSMSYLFIWRPFKMTGNTMLPTFHDGQYLATKRIRTNNQINRGEAVFFDSPAEKDKTLVKRIIGLPEENIMIQNGQVYINENILDEPYLAPKTETLPGKFLPEGVSLKLKSNQYFVLGDNRDHSFKRMGTNYERKYYQ